MSFFQIWNENPPTVLPIFGQKTINYTKTTLDYIIVPKSQYAVFSHFHEILSIAPIQRSINF